jgi:hypothetical protein
MNAPLQPVLEYRDALGVYWDWPLTKAMVARTKMQTLDMLGLDLGIYTLVKTLVNWILRVKILEFAKRLARLVRLREM